MHDQYALTKTCCYVQVGHNTPNVSSPLLHISARSIFPNDFCSREYKESVACVNVKSVLAGWRIVVRLFVGFYFLSPSLLPQPIPDSFPKLLTLVSLPSFLGVSISSPVLSKSILRAQLLNPSDTVLYYKGSSSQRPHTNSKLILVHNVLETSPLPSEQLCTDDLSGPLHHIFSPSLQSKECIFSFSPVSLGIFQSKLVSASLKNT